MSEDAQEVGEAKQPPENYPAYKHELVQKAEEIDGVVTEVEEHRYGHMFHAVQEVDGTAWMASIETDDGEGMDREEERRRVTFRKCRPGNDIHVLYSWSTVAVKALHGPSDLVSWRAIFRVFEAADELVRSYPRPTSQEVEDDD